MPEIGSVSAKIIISNIGYEEGNLKYEVNKKNLNVPNFFDKNEISIAKHLLSTKVLPRSSPHDEIIINLPIKKYEVREFAEVLKIECKKKRKYFIPITYWTTRIDGKTNPRSLNIFFTLDYFRNEIVNVWTENKPKYGITNYE